MSPSPLSPRVGKAAATTTIRSLCPKCGTIRKSRKNSCCGRGGSWFRNCGRGGSNTKLDHTWYEGIQACKTTPSQFREASGRQSNAAQRLNSSNGVPMGDFNTVIAAKVFTPMTANTSIPIPVKTSIITPTNASMNKPTSTEPSKVITTVIATTTMITQTVKEATIVTDWISQGMCSYSRNVSNFVITTTVHLRTLVTNL